MVHVFPGLHNPDNTGLDLVLPVLVNLLPSLVPLRFRFSLAGTSLLDLYSKYLNIIVTVGRIFRCETTFSVLFINPLPSALQK